MPITVQMCSALDRLYGVFAKYEKPLRTDPCPCCHTEEDERTLLSKPLRELGIDELNKYIFDALLTWGGESEFKHFLPRVFELCLTGTDEQRVLIDPEIVFSKFRHAHWLQWPAHEQEAVRHLLHVVWSDVINSPPQPHDLETWLCSIAQAEDDLCPYLNEMLEEKKRSAVSQSLSSLILREGREAFWNFREIQYDQFLAWMKSPLVISRLQEIRDQSSDEEEYAAFHAAYLVVTSTD